MAGQGGPAVRFELLGPLRAWRQDAAVRLGPLQQRVVLAVLLTHANRTIGRPQLIDAIWGDAVPDSAVNLLQRHVSALRRALEPDRSARSGSGQLIWTDTGYLLKVADTDLDLTVFDREVTRARALRTAGDLPAAAQALHAALRLWRGPAFDGLVSPFLNAQRDVLDERRISVVEERVEVDLALGSHRDLIAELRHLVADHPLRERLRGLLMLALYRSDRQADALAAFQDARRRLRDELGVEPAAPLQRLHQQILAADPGLAASADERHPGSAAAAPAAPAASAVPAVPAASAAPAAPHAPVGTTPVPSRMVPQIRHAVPAQLPHSRPDFTGRGEEIDRLNALLPEDGKDPARAVVITAIAGTAGVGKTALAVHWAHRISHRFPDGQLYVNLRGFDPTGSLMEPGEAIRGFLDALAVPTERIPVSLDAQAALYRSLLAGRRVLVVLDNARDADQVRPLLPGSSGCLVIVTSRNQLSSLVATDGAHPLVVDLLPVEEAGTFLARRLGATRVGAEAEAVAEIVTACARLPLALAIVAARAATQPRFPLAVLAAELRRTRSRLDAFAGDDRATDVRTVFSWSYDQLSEAAAKMFAVLGLHPGPDLATPAAASLAGIPVEQARRLLAELTRAHLITEYTPDRYTFHDLLRTYAAEQIHGTDPKLDRSGALDRMFDHYLGTAYAATRLLDPHRDDLALDPVQLDAVRVDLPDSARAMEWFTAEHPVLVAAFNQAAGAGFDRHAWQLAWTLVTFHDRRGLWRDSAAIHHTALDAANRLADPLGQALSHRNLARAYAHLSRYDDARLHLHQALDLFRGLGNRTGQAHAHFSLARVRSRQGSHHEALGHARQALNLYAAEGHQSGRGGALNAIGWFHAVLGDPEQALAYCEAALRLHQDLGDHIGQASASDSLGYAHHHLGGYREATEYYHRAIELWRKFGDRYNEADTLIHLGDTHHAAGDHEAARDVWQYALKILDELTHTDAEEVRAKLNKLTDDPSTR